VIDLSNNPLIRYYVYVPQNIPDPDSDPPTITDALEILKYLAGIPSIYDDSEESPTIDDAMEILKIIAEIIPPKVREVEIITRATAQ
jgi:hypothetical protein